jgi:rubrerythrin
VKVIDELTELWDAAIYKEIASQALYEAGQKRTQDPGARALMKELAEEELKQSQWLKEFKDKGIEHVRWHRTKVPNLMISEYLTGGDSLADASLQGTLVFALKREQQSIEFYVRMMSMVRDKTAKRLCGRLIHAELKHKLRLERLYNDLFYAED